MKFERLDSMAQIEVSGVDKKTKENEIPVKLCNFVDVYHNWAITADNYNEFMDATAKEEEINTFKLCEGQVAITKDSETRDDIGISTYIAQNFDDVILGYHTALITPDNKKLDGAYLNAFMHSKASLKHFENNASGSGQRYTLSDEAIKSLKVLIPDTLEEQKRISKVLTDIDSKIAVNKKMNRELEIMAKELYEYWFLQFDYPNAEGKPYKSSGGKMIYNEILKREIPEGWEVKKISDFVDIFTGKKDVSKVIPGPYKFFSCAPTAITSNDFIYDGEAVLVSGNGSYTGRVSYYKGKMDLYQRTYGCKPKQKYEKIMPFLYYSMKFLFQPIMTGGKHGSSVPYIVLEDLADFKVAYNDSIVSDFLNCIGSIFYKHMEINPLENEQLEMLRDELLPLLMNGQVSIK